MRSLKSYDLSKFNPIPPLLTFLGIRQARFAADLDISNTLVTFLVKGDRKPSAKLIRSISVKYDLRENWWVEGASEILQGCESQGFNPSIFLPETRYLMLETDRILREMEPDDRTAAVAAILGKLNHHHQALQEFKLFGGKQSKGHNKTRGLHK